MSQGNRSGYGARTYRTLCPICGRRLRGKKGLKMHTESEHGVDAASVVAAATAEAETIAASPLQVGDRVTARLLFGTFDGLTVVEVLPVARRARVAGWMGRYTGSGDERQDNIEVAFEDINPAAES